MSIVLQGSGAYNPVSIPLNGSPNPRAGGLTVQPAGGSNLQGSSPNLQGSSYNPQQTAPSTVLQNTANPMDYLSPPSGGGGQVTGAVTEQSNYVAPDPYARWGGRANYDALLNSFGVTQGGYQSGAETTLGDIRNEYDTRTRNFLNSIEDTQGEIDRGGAFNQLNLRRSMQNIIRGLQTGLRSGGVALAGMNASNSGAADAMARAYARVGNQQAGEAQGEFNIEAEDLQRQQGQLNRSKTEGISDLDLWQDTETGRVRSDFGNKLQVLKTQADAQGLGGEVNVGLVDQVLNDALAKLAVIDSQRQQRLAGIKPMTPQEVMAEAIRLDELGVAGNTFQVAGPNVNYGGQSIAGAPLPDLPIYVNRGREEDRA